MKRLSYKYGRFKTQYVQLKTKNCKACWKCIENCPQDVIGRIDFLGHRHARMKNPADCTGCLKCVSVCKFNAISPLPEKRTAAMRINNDMYRRLGHAWWDDDVGEFSTIRFFVNPVRFTYFRRVIGPERIEHQPAPAILDVGCGGGLLAEEFARAGFRVTGIDPAPETITTAIQHAENSGLIIDYKTGSGENLPFADESFDYVACCDVLEHVDDVNRVIGEIKRVLKPNGLFLYDTVNRTIKSKMGVIKVMQEWPSTAFAEPNSHVWDRFIRPAELCRMLDCHGLDQRDMRGISSQCNPISALLDFRRRVKGKISFKELGRRLAFHESSDLSVSYMGYAVKRE